MSGWTEPQTTPSGGSQRRAYRSGRRTPLSRPAINVAEVVRESLLARRSVLRQPAGMFLPAALRSLAARVYGMRMPSLPRRKQTPRSEIKPLIAFRVSPEEFRAIDAACAQLRFTRSALIRHTLAEVIRVFNSAVPVDRSSFATVLPAPAAVPKPNALRYDPREYRRLWANQHLQRQADNAVEHHLDQVKAAAAGQGEYPSVRDTEALFRNCLLEQKAKGKLSD